jgi:hypothetical protein
LNIKNVKDIRDLAPIAKKIESATGLKLAADREDDAVDGWIDGIEYPPDSSGVCALCGDSFTNGHSCIKISTYDKDEAPNKEHKTTLRKASISSDKEKKIKALFD